ncbi:uncharacterized protein LOC135498129 [Lineus longissimus]|uniref:uncharacterized protein LOC135498129 n=1 Tax=Lineus longissimus TaxID=88925 RepID=UPI002B4D734F
MATYSLLVSVLLGVVSMVAGHGRLIEPPSRVSAWRFGFKTPVDYDDDGWNCGGVGMQYDRSGGKCGICGDSYPGPRKSEAGGKYAKGVIVRHYKKGQIIDIKVDITANHWGWFEFKLCANNDVTKPATEACLNQTLLYLPEHGSTRWSIGSAVKVYKVKAQLPAGMTCSQCVLQWKYNAGNSWGTDPDTGRSGIGLGNQEQFLACADISIS